MSINRRDFVKTTAVAAAATAVGMTLPKKLQRQDYVWCRPFKTTIDAAWCRWKIQQRRKV